MNRLTARLHLAVTGERGRVRTACGAQCRARVPFAVFAGMAYVYRCRACRHSSAFRSLAALYAGRVVPTDYAPSRARAVPLLREWCHALTFEPPPKMDHAGGAWRVGLKR